MVEVNESTKTSEVQQRPPEYQADVTLDTIPADGQQLLQVYGGLKHEEILPHVLHIREKGFEIAQFACIGQIKFLNNRMPKLPYYVQFMNVLRAGGKLLDVGCGLGQELRYLAVNDSIDPAQLHGCDLELRLIDLGYDLFRDRDRFKANLFAADLMGQTGQQPQLDHLEGQMDLLQVSQVLHVFDWDDMLTACKRLVALGKPVPGTMIAGTQMGSKNAGSYPMPRRNFGTGMNFRHNFESMERFWGQIGVETNSQWRVGCCEIPSKAVEQNKNAWWAKIDPGGSYFRKEPSHAGQLCAICRYTLREEAWQKARSQKRGR